MARRVLPALLGLGAFVADLSGSHGVALVFLLAAIPAAFAFALECYGDALEARCSTLRPILAGAALLLLVFCAALRSPAVIGGVPQLAVSTLAIPLLLYAAIGLGALLPGARPVVRITAPQDASVPSR
jgi:hypothetical protein